MDWRQEYGAAEIQWYQSQRNALCLIDMKYNNIAYMLAIKRAQTPK